MPDQIYIGNFKKGQSNYLLPFNIDNDAFPLLYNFYSWRGRVKKKRGTITLGRLQVQAEISSSPNNYQLTQFALVNGEGNLVTQYSLGNTSTLVPGSLGLDVAGNTYTDLDEDGILVGNPSGSGTVNYATGEIVITGGGSNNVTGYFSYYTGLPVMGLKDFVSSNSSSQYPLLLAFDTKYSYQVKQPAQTFYNTTFYKGTETPFTWSGQDYEQFWTTNYEGSLWATNNKPGIHLVTCTYSSGSGTTTITMNLKRDGSNVTTLIVGDKIWFNEWNSGGSNINGMCGSVSDITGASSGNYVVTFADTRTVASTGIGQLLTHPISGQDGIRFYDGDPTDGSGIPASQNKGWVNFAPPLTETSVVINNKTSGLYYLVGALAIVPFKDRLLFFSPWIQTSTGVAIQLKDTVIWSWNGTPYYTVDSIGNAVSVPDNRSADVSAYFVDQTGKGGFLSAGVDQPITTISNNEDVLLVGFGGTGRKTRFVYTGDDLQPFLFFLINSELPSSATFSSISLDRGAIDLGVYGIAITDQQSSQRIDLEIPTKVFEINGLNNGLQRVNAIRDFFKEWIYFSYPVNNSRWKYPTQTLLYNYRDNTWAVFYENFTCHGNYRKSNGYTWSTLPFKTWASWREPWNSGTTTALFPSIVAGTPQGFVLIKGQGTGEGQSGSIKMTSAPISISDITQAASAVVTVSNTTNFVVGQRVYLRDVQGMSEINNDFNSSYVITNVGSSTITLDVNSSGFSAYTSGGTVYTSIYSIDHCTDVGDYLYFLGSLGLSGINEQIAKVLATPDANNFFIDNDIMHAFTGTYTGNGTFARLCQPLLQTKQFPVYWQEGKKTRLGVQKYLMDKTTNGQVTVNIYLSQNDDDPWNNPVLNTPPSSLIYSQVLYTCAESTNIGLTPSNTNLQMPMAATQYQIWHRFNTSLIGDSIQIGITLSDEQMRNLTYATSEIVLQAINLVVDRGPYLA